MGDNFIFLIRIYQIIIVVIITWPSEKTNSDITVIRASDSFKWVMFMQNFEHNVTVNNHLEAITCVLLFTVFDWEVCKTPSFSLNYYTKY